MMKKIKLLGLLIIAALGFNSCSQDDDLVFTAVAPVEGVSFSNTFLGEYVLTPATASNLGERFTWSDASFEAPTPITYELQKSIIGDFSEEDITIGITDGNEIAITIGQMLGYAAEAGLDSDPDTDEPNTGQIYFRVRAFPGEPSSSIEAFTPVQALTVVLPEDIGTGGGAFAISSWGVVGSGYNNWAAAGAPLDAPFYTTATAGVIVSYVNLVNGEIKFRENNTWGGDLGDANLDGVLDADSDNNIAVTAGDYKITIDTNDMSYTIEPFSWGVVGSGFNDWGSDGPDAKFYYDYTTDTFKVGVRLIDGEIKFRQNNEWAGTDVGDANLDGVLDQDSDNNIAVTEGHYLITINLNDNTYTIEIATVWGAVGSGFNDWGSGGPDAHLTEIQPGVWFVENVTLIDGEIKFRADDTWSGDLGDANLDNILDSDADNNIAVTSGNHVITIDFNDVDGPKYLLGKRQ